MLGRLNPERLWSKNDAERRDVTEREMNEMIVREQNQIATVNATRDTIP
jgi:hypothetical protein